MVDTAPVRRSERARRAILDAAVELCAELGYEKVSVDAIAARAGVGKQTIYRWWRSKATVVLEAIDDAAGTVTDFPDTGDLRADLRKQMRGVARLMTSERFAIYSALIGEAQTDPLIAAAIVTTVLEPRRVACRARLESARAAGQLRDDIDLDLAIELLYAPLYYRLLLRTGSLSRRHVDQVLDAVLVGLAPR